LHFLANRLEVELISQMLLILLYPGLSIRKCEIWIYVLLFRQKHQNQLPKRCYPPALEQYRKSKQSSGLLSKHSLTIIVRDAFAGFAGIVQFTATLPAVWAGLPAGNQ